jgi:hypothetical protein
MTTGFVRDAGDTLERRHNVLRPAERELSNEGMFPYLMLGNT